MEWNLHKIVLMHGSAYFHAKINERQEDGTYNDYFDFSGENVDTIDMWLHFIYTGTLGWEARFYYSTDQLHDVIELAQRFEEYDLGRAATELLRMNHEQWTPQIIAFDIPGFLRYVELVLRLWRESARDIRKELYHDVISTVAQNVHWLIRLDDFRHMLGSSPALTFGICANLAQNWELGTLERVNAEDWRPVDADFTTRYTQTGPPVPEDPVRAEAAPAALGIPHVADAAVLQARQRRRRPRDDADEEERGVKHARIEVLE